MQQKTARSMTKASSRKMAVKAAVQPAVIALANLDQPDALTPMNFRVSQQFHREFKLYAVQHGMSMVALLQESFRLMKERRTK